MRLYVAGPMTGYPRWNYAAFTDAAARLRAAGYQVTAPHEMDEARGFDPDAPVDDFGRADYVTALLSDIHAVAAACGVAVLPGWSDSPGATAEVAFAAAIGIPFADVDDWVAAGEAFAADSA